MINDNGLWFTEVCEEGGSALSLKIKAKLHEEQTQYQKIEIFETESYGNLMVIDGYVMLTARDNFVYHEMMTHPAMFTHADPRNVVIIGGGDCGSLREVLKHQTVEETWQVEIDERVTRLSEKYFPELCESNHDPRAHFYFGDGIKWMEESRDESVDIIIVDSTDPIGPAEGLYAEPFYRECIRSLKNGGILVQQSESPLLHLDILRDMRQRMNAAGFEDVKSIGYPQTTYPSGWWSATLAGKDVTLDSFREAEAGPPKFDTAYYNVAVHKAAFALPTFLKRMLTQED